MLIIEDKIKKEYYKKGFTLIELLVVIAIIGILSSVVLASLNMARISAAEAAFKSEVLGALPGLIIACDGVIGDILQGDLDLAASGRTISSVVSISGTCPNGFSATFTAEDGATGNCTGATVAETGVVGFVGC